MTTIAWDGRVLAADRQVTENYGGINETTKLVLVAGYAYGANGRFQESVFVVDWLKRGASIAQVFEEGTFEDSTSKGLVVKLSTRETFRIQGQRRLALTPFEGVPLAAGSGLDYAMMAMALGKSAVEAVKAAMRFDAFTGVGVDFIDLSTPAKRKRPRITRA